MWNTVYILHILIFIWGQNVKNEEEKVRIYKKNDVVSLTQLVARAKWRHDNILL